MIENGWFPLAAGMVLAAIGLWLIRWRRRAVRQYRLARAMDGFHVQREHVEAKFFQLAAGSGIPRGLAWTHCQFDDEVAYARDRQTGQLTALVGATIAFAAIQGGGMEDVEAVGNLRLATAVFFFADGRWTTRGRAIFNLNPAEAVAYYRNDLEMVVPQTP